MLVRDCMTANPIRVHPESDPLAALGLCKSAHIRRLPVVDAEDHIVGLVTRNMLEQFLAKAPSPGVMRRQHAIEQVMVSPALTVSPDYPLEEAARLMVVHKIGYALDSRRSARHPHARDPGAAQCAAGASVERARLGIAPRR
jgi:acetoin utilization protein AcuB